MSGRRRAQPGEPAGGEEKPVAVEGWGGERVGQTRDRWRPEPEALEQSPLQGSVQIQWSHVHSSSF